LWAGFLVGLLAGHAVSGYPFVFFDQDHGGDLDVTGCGHLDKLPEAGAAGPGQFPGCA
jgi:hypothetical protein